MLGGKPDGTTGHREWPPAVGGSGGGRPLWEPGMGRVGENIPGETARVSHVTLMAPLHRTYRGPHPPPPFTQTSSASNLHLSWSHCHLPRSHKLPAAADTRDPSLGGSKQGKVVLSRVWGPRQDMKVPAGPFSPGRSQADQLLGLLDW